MQWLVKERIPTYHYSSRLSGQNIRVLRNWTAAPARGVSWTHPVRHMPFRQPGP